MFMCRLSLAWGIPPTEIEQEVSAADVDLMLRYYAVEPWGPWRDNAHAGVVAAAVANAFRGEKQRAFSYDDFMLVDEETRERKRAERSAAGANALWQTLSAMAPKVTDGSG